MSITIVTAFFTMPSKHTKNNYLGWIKNFLLLNENMVIFTDNETYEYINNLRNSSNTHIIVTSIDKFDTYKYIDYWNYCKSIDIEPNHTTQLYMIWNEKTFFIEKAINMNKFNSEYFFWMDIGCIRDEQMIPYIKKFSCIGIDKNKTIISKVSTCAINNQLNGDGISFDLQNKNGKSCDMINYIQGGFFGGHTQSLKNWINLYKNELELFIRTKTFGGKDQYIMNNISIKFPEYIYCLNPSDNKLFNVWFSFLIRMNNLSKCIT
jgi:hypothetical protein